MPNLGGGVPNGDVWFDDHGGTRTRSESGQPRWGLAIDPETGIVYASDMRTGRWIIQPTGPAAPSS
jgi:hypothetical protein